MGFQFFKYYKKIKRVINLGSFARIINIMSNRIISLEKLVRFFLKEYLIKVHKKGSLNNLINNYLRINYST